MRAKPRQPQSVGVGLAVDQQKVRLLRGIRGSQPNRRLGHGRGAWRQAADRSPGPRERASNRYRA